MKESVHTIIESNYKLNVRHPAFEQITIYKFSANDVNPN